MMNGRPAQGNQGAFFYENARTINVSSLKNEVAAPGWCYYLGDFD
jgi:hypothetical protein